MAAAAARAVSVGPTASGDESEESREQAPSRQGTLLQRAGSNLEFQRASTLPTEARELRHAATMPILSDIESDRPFCCGLWKAQQLFGFVVGVLLLVFAWMVRPIKDYESANYMLGIALLCGSFWVFEVIPIYVTSLLPLILIPFCKITSTDVIAASYWNSIQMLFIATYLVDIAMEEVRLPRRATLKLLLSTGVMRPGRLLFSFMVICWFFSMFISSIAVTLMITPFALGLISASEERARDQEVDAAIRDEEMSGSEVEPPNKKSQEVQRFADGLLLGIAYSATAGGIATLTGSIPNRVLVGLSLIQSHIGWMRWFAFGLPISAFVMLAAYGIIWVKYVRGMRLIEMTKEALESEYQELLSEAGPFSRDELMVLFVAMTQILFLILRPYTVAPYVTTAFGSHLVQDATVASIPSVLLFFIPSSLRPGQAVLTWVAVHEKFDFGLLILIGGGFAIAKGFEESGLNSAMGYWFLHLTRDLSMYCVTMVIMLCGSAATQLFSTVGAATMMLPVLMSAALDELDNPMQLALPAAVSCSLAFMLPTATPANVVVLAKSQDLSRPLRVKDFLCTGLPLNLVAIFLGALLVQGMGIVVFDSAAPFPRASCGDGMSNCVWMPIAGEVSGRYVYSQACIVLDKYQDEKCMIWNGSVYDVPDEKVTNPDAPIPVPGNVTEGGPPAPIPDAPTQPPPLTLPPLPTIPVPTLSQAPAVASGL